MMEMLAALERTGFASWLRESGSIWAYPTVLTAHTVGLAILVGASTALDLRVLGAGSGIEVSAMEPLFPLMWWGLAINAISGAMLFCTDATTKGTTLLFMGKLASVAAAVIVMVLLRRSLFAAPRRGVITSGAQFLAVASLLLWMTAITTGRLMAYL